METSIWNIWGQVTYDMIICHMESTSTDQLGPLGAISMAKVLKSSHQQRWENSAMFDRSKDSPESIDRVIITYPLTANLWP